MKQYLSPPSSLYEQAKARYLEISALYQQLERRVKKYPSGKIHVVRHGNCVQYYLRTDQSDKSGKYISKREEGKIRLYLQKKYDEAVLSHLKLEKKRLERFLSISKTKSSSILNSHISNQEKIRIIFSNNPDEVKRIITPIDVSDEDYVKEWLSESYEIKEISQNITSYITNRGEQVRSKSELTIANALDKQGIPYKYECPLLSNGITIHPDFTILNVKERREIYWEHRGMMDDRDYARHTVQRLKQLEKEGIMLGYNLIITEETLSSPLGTEEIELMIRNYLI